MAKLPCHRDESKVSRRKCDNFHAWNFIEFLWISAVVWCVFCMFWKDLLKFMFLKVLSSFLRRWVEIHRAGWFHLRKKRVLSAVSCNPWTLIWSATSNYYYQIWECATVMENCCAQTTSFFVLEVHKDWTLWGKLSMDRHRGSGPEPDWVCFGWVLLYPLEILMGDQKIFSLDQPCFSCLFETFEALIRVSDHGQSADFRNSVWFCLLYCHPSSWFL